MYIMEQYNYEITNPNGKIEKGTISASTREEAYKILHDQGNTVLNIEVTKGTKTASKGTKVNTLELIIFFDHMQKMIDAGLSLSDTLTALVDDAQTPSFKNVIMELKHEVETGNKLSIGLQKYPKTFSHVVTKMIEVGETSGTLSESAKMVKDDLQKSYDLKKKVRGAMLYPLIIGSVMLIVGIGLVIFVFPQLGTIFATSGLKLPLPTRIMLGISKLLTTKAYIGVPSLIAIIIIVKLLIAKPYFKLLWNRMSIRLPILGPIIRNISIATFSRTFGHLIQSGIQINQAVEITKDSMTNEEYKMVIEELSKEIQKGAPISSTLEKYPKLFPPISVRMIAVGDKTGNTAEMLNSVAVFYQTQVDDTLDNLSTIIEPIMLFIMGGGVLLIALSVIMPIYQMTGSINANTGSTQTGG